MHDRGAVLAGQHEPGQRERAGADDDRVGGRRVAEGGERAELQAHQMSVVVQVREPGELRPRIPTRRDPTAPVPFQAALPGCAEGPERGSVRADPGHRRCRQSGGRMTAQLNELGERGVDNPAGTQIGALQPMAQLNHSVGQPVGHRLIMFPQHDH